MKVWNTRPLEDALQQRAEKAEEDNEGMKSILEQAGLVIEQETEDEQVLECVECGAPFGEGHTPECKHKNTKLEEWQRKAKQFLYGTTCADPDDQKCLDELMNEKE